MSVTTIITMSSCFYGNNRIRTQSKTFQLIVYPHEAPPGIRLILSMVPLIWICALFLASPLAIWKKLENWTEWTDSMNLLG